MSNNPRIMLAAPKSGSGKTLITCALLQNLLFKKMKPVSFKCGPDYIDPMFHQAVLGIHSKNLDTFFTGKKRTRQLLLEGMKDCDIAVLEGVMGLYDGLAGISDKASSYDLARVSQTPIILVIDTRGMARSVIPLISGFLKYDKEHLIKGVILNKMSGMMFQLVKKEIEKELKINVVGYVPMMKDIHIESRHLGLLLPQEIEDLKEQLNQAANVLDHTIDFETLFAIASGAKPIKVEQEKPSNIKAENKVNIGIARDEAFCFYYEDNSKRLQEMGVECIPFSPIHDEKLPDGIQGILLGGGYPELYAKELSKNHKMRAVIKEAIEKGMPSIAECGGFMYLHENLVTQDDKTYSMVGVIPGKCTYAGKLVRFGYSTLTVNKESFLKCQSKIKAHEFHYFDSDDNGTDCIAVKPISNRSFSCVQAGVNYWWGFPHLYYDSNKEFVKRFAKSVRKYKG
ncbi:MAG: cobyrinate a,c-diamide synthase [Velocimicrobium sp.]